MKATSTVFYTFEDIAGYAETHDKQTFETIVSQEQVKDFIQLELENEGETIKVPILAGYKKPYDFPVTDEIGTEHYIYYEEIEEAEEGYQCH